MKPKKESEVTQSFSVTKYSKGSASKEQVQVVVEKPFQILINDSSVANIMLTPSFLGEFLTGFLIGQGIAGNLQQIKRTLIEPEKGLLWAEVEEPAKIDITKTLITSGCVGGVSLQNFSGIEPLKKAEPPDPDLVGSLMKNMLTGGEIYAKSGGVHSACLASVEDGILFRVEDIGRHNCLDKVIGHLILNEINPEGKLILTTGRLSLEAVPKAVRAKVGILGSRSTPTNLAIDLAKKLNLVLLGYIRAGKMTIYT